MNVRISRLYRLLALAFVTLIATVTYWQIWAAPGLAERRSNPRLVYKQLTIDRGRILTRDGVVLATNRADRGQNGRTLYRRVYPQKDLAVHLQGYNSVENSRSGLEQAENDYLTGASSDLSGSLGHLWNEQTGQHVVGNDLVLSLDTKAQQAALKALRATGRRGAVIALEPATGRILAMVSLPDYDPNGDLTKVFGAAGSPAYNRVTQGLYPPGSTFKVVTAAASLERDPRIVDRTFRGGSCIRLYGRPFCNFHGESPGAHSFEEALVHSYNTTFATLGLELGADRLRAFMARFGFGSRIPIDYPSDQIGVAGLYERGRLLQPRAPIDVARTAVGQGRLLATPLQMAMVAAAVANGGRLMEPQAVTEVRARSGRVVERRSPHELGRVMSPATAAVLRRMMGRVVEEGTGTAARGIEGLSVAGKTGTAETGRAGQNDAWFIAFAPVEQPRVALAVVIEDVPQTGGVVAAPVARAVIEAFRR